MEAASFFACSSREGFCARLSACPRMRARGVRISWETPEIHSVRALSRLSRASFWRKSRIEASFNFCARVAVSPRSGRLRGFCRCRRSIPPATDFKER